MDRKALFGNRASKLPVRNSGANRRSRSLSRNTLGNAVTGSVRSTRTRSVSQTPAHLYPGSAIRDRSRSAEKSRFKKKDIRPVSDKQWQVKQTTKTQKYLIESGYRDILNNGTTLRPLTLNMFVQIMNTLLEPVTDEELTNANYIERVPSILNILKYPGVYSASVLKSANTTCSWPHILAIISWLTVIHEWVTKELEIEETEEKPLETKINDLKHNTIMKAYLSFNKQNDIKNIAEWYSTELDKVLDLPDDIEKMIEKNMVENNRIVKECCEIERKDQAELEQLENDKFKLKSDMDTIIRVIQEKENHIKDDENKIKHINFETIKVEEDIKRLEEELKTLEQKNQDVDYQQLLTIVTNLEKQIENNKETVQYKKNLDKKFNITLNNKKVVLNAKTKDYNMKLIKQSLRHPELEDILLPQDMNTVADFNKILDEAYDKAEALKKNGNKKKEKHQHEIASLIKQIQKEKLKEDGKIKELNRLKKVKKAVGEEIQQFKDYTEKETETYLKDIDEKKQKFKELSKTIIDADDKKKNEKESEERLKKTEEGLEEFEKNMIHFFKNLKSLNQQQLTYIDDSMRRVDDKIADIANKFEDSIKSLKRN